MTYLMVYKPRSSILAGNGKSKIVDGTLNVP